MTRNRQLRRILIASIASSTFNVVLGMVAIFSYNHRNEQRYRGISKLLDVLSQPAAAIAEHLAPSGHDAAHFLGGAVIAIVFSLIFYGVLAWFVIAVLSLLHRPIR